MVMSNPREQGLWTPRTQEFTGGFNGREMLDYDINPNEDSDGLSHHSLKTPEDEESVNQSDPKKRRERALRELASQIPHISIKPMEIDDVLGRTPMTDGMQQLLESGMGVDMGLMANGGSLAAGANAGPIRSPTGQISYQSDIGKSSDDHYLSYDDSVPEDAKQWAYGTFDRMMGADRASKEDERTVIEMLKNVFPQIYRNQADGKMPFVSPAFVRNHVEEILAKYGLDMKSEFIRVHKADSMSCRLCGKPLEGIVEQARKSRTCFQCLPPDDPAGATRAKPPREFDMPSLQEAEDNAKRVLDMNDQIDPAFAEFVGKIPYFRASEDDYTSLSDIIKARRKYKGRRYTEDEESDEDERKSKAKHKRKKKQRGSGKNAGGGSREPKSKSKRRAKSTERNLSRSSKTQAFHPNVNSHAMRSLGSGRSDQLPLRLRDPVAYQRKLAAEKFRRQMGSLPRGLSVHADTRGIGGRGTVIGAKLPKTPSMGTNTSRYKFRAGEGAVGDPLGTQDFIKAPKKQTITALDVAQLRAMLKRLEQKLNRLTKAPVELNDNAKVGAQATEERSSDPGADGATRLNEEERAGYRVEDPTILQAAGVLGKR